MHRLSMTFRITTTRTGDHTVQSCEDMSNQMVEQFCQADQKKRFDILHFHDWHPIQALFSRLKSRETILTFHSTEFGRNGNQYGDWWIRKQGKNGPGGLIAKRVTAVSTIMKNEVMRLYNIPDWKCDVVPNGFANPTVSCKY